MRRGRLDDRGVSPAIAFMVATVLFAGTFFFVIDSGVRQNKDTSQADETSLISKAASLASTVVQPGVGWYNAFPCDAMGLKIPSAFDPEDVSLLQNGVVTGRFGIGAERFRIRYRLEGRSGYLQAGTRTPTGGSIT